MEDTWLSVEEAVELSGYHPQHIRDLARDGRVTARRFGRRAWRIERGSLLEYVESMQELGRKRGPKGGEGAPDEPA
jgi:excisionase family DNA binding protein